MGVVQRVLSAASRMRAVCVVPLVPFRSASGRWTVSRSAGRVGPSVGRNGMSTHAEAEKLSEVRGEVTGKDCTLTRLASEWSGAPLPACGRPGSRGTGKNTVRRGGSVLWCGGPALQHCGTESLNGCMPH